MAEADTEAALEGQRLAHVLGRMARLLEGRHRCNEAKSTSGRFLHKFLEPTVLILAANRVTYVVAWRNVCDNPPKWSHLGWGDIHDSGRVRKSAIQAYSPCHSS